MVVWTTIGVRAHLKRGAISAYTRRLHAYVQKMLFSLAAVLFAAFVVPNIVASTIVVQCAHYAYINFFSSSFILLAEALASPCITVYFVRPYRDEFRRLVGCAAAVAHFSADVERATKTAVPPPAPSLAASFVVSPASQPSARQVLSESRV